LAGISALFPCHPLIKFEDSTKFENYQKPRLNLNRCYTLCADATILVSIVAELSMKNKKNNIKVRITNCRNGKIGLDYKLFGKPLDVRCVSAGLPKCL